MYNGKNTVQEHTMFEIYHSKEIFIVVKNTFLSYYIANCVTYISQ